MVFTSFMKSFVFALLCVFVHGKEASPAVERNEAQLHEQSSPNRLLRSHAQNHNRHHQDHRKDVDGSHPGGSHHIHHGAHAAHSSIHVAHEAAYDLSKKEVVFKSGDTQDAVVQPDGIVNLADAQPHEGHHHHQHKKEKGYRPLACKGSGTCARDGRFKPHRSFLTESMDMIQTKRLLEKMKWTGTLAELPNTVMCQIAVDDTLDGVWYNGIELNTLLGIPIPAQLVGNSANLCQNTPYTISFVPVKGAILQIIAHDAQPGTGVATCAGIGVMCYTGDLRPYSDIHNYTSWKARAQATYFANEANATHRAYEFGPGVGGQTTGTAPQMLSTGNWTPVAPGTTSSLSCGITRKMPIRIWQHGAPIVSIMWVTPSGMPTTTTTTPNITNTTNVTVIKADAGRIVPGLLSTLSAIAMSALLMSS